jgi:hypothetical protein
VQEKVKEGRDLSQAFNECGICNDPKIGDKGGVLAVMTGDRITRPDYTVQAIEMAILALNPTHYKCGPSVPHGINDKKEETIFKSGGGGSCCGSKK